MGRVLYVDDDEQLRRLMRRSLGRDHDVMTVGSVSEAREQVGYPFDVLLLDYRLFDGTGIDVARAFREAGSDALAVIFTGFADAADVVEAESDGIVFFVIDKGLESNAVPEIVTRIVEAVQSKRALRSER